MCNIISSEEMAIFIVYNNDGSRQITVVTDENIQVKYEIFYYKISSIMTITNQITIRKIDEENVSINFCLTSNDINYELDEILLVEAKNKFINPVFSLNVVPHNIYYLPISRMEEIITIENIQPVDATLGGVVTPEDWN